MLIATQLFSNSPTVCEPECVYSKVKVPVGGQSRLAFWDSTVINVPMAHCYTSN